MLVLQVGDRPLRSDHDSADLERQGLYRERTNSLEEAVAFIELYEFEVILADLDFCRDAGFDVIRELRAVSAIPIIGVTISLDPRIKIAALDIGADDVLTEMCGLEELLARLRAVVRRRFGHAQSTLRSGRLQLSLVGREARVDDIPLRLGPKEYLLLEFLILKRGSAVSKSACMAHLYGTDDYPEAKTIDVVLCRLRKRLAPHGLADAIASVWGFGYKLTAPAAAPSVLRHAVARMRPIPLVAA